RKAPAAQPSCAANPGRSPWESARARPSRLAKNRLGLGKEMRAVVICFEIFDRDGARCGAPEILRHLNADVPLAHLSIDSNSSLERDWVLHAGFQNAHLAISRARALTHEVKADRRDAAVLLELDIGD